MFDVVKVKFLASSSGRMHPSEVNYEYRVPDYLKGRVEVGMHGVVSWKNNGQINPTVVEITKVGNVLDGDWTATDYADLIAVFSLEPWRQARETEKRRQRVLDLIEQEKQRVTTGLNFAQLAALSPVLSELVKELQSLNGEQVEKGEDKQVLDTAGTETRSIPAETYTDGDGFVRPLTQPSRDDGKTSF